MPELPEVETIVRCLDQALPGSVLQHVQVLGPKCVKCSEETLRELTEGDRVQGVSRKGKLVLIWLQKGPVLVFHLKMTGSLVLTSQQQALLDKHTHLVFSLSDGRALLYRDVRKFGYCRVFFSLAELQSWPFFASLGPDPLQMEPSQFYRLLSTRKGRIKPLLLDQGLLAGIGNIYADESLYLAGIHPFTRANELGEEALLRLHQGMIRVLQEAIQAGGSTFSDFVNASGESGAFQNDFRVYGRGGQPCPSCGDVLQRIVVSGRSSVYCPTCQPAPADKPV